MDQLKAFGYIFAMFVFVVVCSHSIADNKPTWKEGHSEELGNGIELVCVGTQGAHTVCLKSESGMVCEHSGYDGDIDYLLKKKCWEEADND